MIGVARLAVVLLLALTGSTKARAHVDTVFPIAQNGYLQRFPDDYGPASLKIGSQSAESSSVPEIAVVRIGSNEVHLPQCIRALLVIPPSEKIQAHGSWYHDFSLLPPYLVFEFPQRRDEHGGFEGYALMFNMKDGSLREVRYWELLDSGGARGSPVNVTQACTDSELKSLIPQSTSAPVPLGAFDSGHGKTIADCLLIQSLEGELQCLRDQLDYTDKEFAVETGWFASCKELSESTDVLDDLKKFRVHFCQKHLRVPSQASREIEELRCQLELTEASLHQASEFAAKVCLSK